MTHAAANHAPFHIFKYYDMSDLVAYTDIDWQNADFVIHDEDIDHYAGRVKQIMLFYTSPAGTKMSGPRPTGEQNREILQRYLRNGYRVLLTRARQGYVIYVPRGTDHDPTRPPCYYDETYAYLRLCGVRELESSAEEREGQLTVEHLDAGAREQQVHAAVPKKVAFNMPDCTVFLGSRARWPLFRRHRGSAVLVRGTNRMFFARFRMPAGLRGICLLRRALRGGAVLGYVEPRAVDSLVAQ